MAFQAQITVTIDTNDANAAAKAKAELQKFLDNPAAKMVLAARKVTLKIGELQQKK